MSQPATAPFLRRARFAVHAVPTNFAAPGVFLIADSTKLPASARSTSATKFRTRQIAGLA
jgi:hypothetical protein